MCGTAGVSIKSRWWRSPVSPRWPGSRAINQALCHGWTEQGPCVSGGCRRHRPGYPSSVVSLLSLCRSRREGAGHEQAGHRLGTGGYPLVLYTSINIAFYCCHCSQNWTTITSFANPPFKVQLHWQCKVETCEQQTLNCCSLYQHHDVQHTMIFFKKMSKLQRELNGLDL